MTSNIGAEMIRRQGSLGFTLQRDEKETEEKDYEEMRKKLLDSLRKVFRPEFINRLDAVIVFHPLNREHIRRIVNLELEKVAERMAEHDITINASDAALDYLSSEGYNPEMGARPLRRVIQDKVEDRLSDAVLSHEFKNGDSVIVDVNQEKEIVLRRNRKRNSLAKAMPLKEDMEKPEQMPA